MNIFDILNSISNDKKDRATESDFEKEYNPFMINRFLSMDIEALHLAEVMDMYGQYIPKNAQFYFLRAGLPKKKRFFKYLKKETVMDKENIDTLKQHFVCNEEKAMEYIKLLTPAQITDIYNMYKGKSGKGKKTKGY